MNFFFHVTISVRVSNELGAGHPKSAAFSVIVVNVISFIISVIAAIIILALRRVISYAFTEGEVVADAVSDLSPLLALTLVLNGVQPVLSGILTHQASACSEGQFFTLTNICRCKIEELFRNLTNLLIGFFRMYSKEDYSISCFFLFVYLFGI